MAGLIACLEETEVLVRVEAGQFISVFWSHLTSCRKCLGTLSMTYKTTMADIKPMFGIQVESRDRQGSLRTASTSSA